ncbi:homocysteine S-methyltransferase family protein [uncultured Eubacterium sp.]|uniref:homocysteine S-methyltransferase family protein n=1 Tax=Eubacterium sp. TaxID=142586 RepID=UPI0026DAB4BE|nr:homocysteine S-methyltransferase family protein [uncultured Eubacterium sp.]
MDVKELLKKGYIVLDGAMGTMLQKKGMKMGVVPETLGITKPEWIIDIHKQYIEAGSDIVYANTFGANRYKLKGTGYSTEEIIKKAIKNGRKACEGSESFVALDIGPIGQLLEPTGSLSFEEAYDIFKEEILAGKDADVIVIETMTDLLETKAAVLAAKENSNLPVFVTMTFEENKRTFTGCSVSAMVLTIVGLGVDAIGVNCSLGPDQLAPIVEEIGKWSDIPVIVKANAGLPDPVTNEYDVTPEQFVEDYKQMLKFGARIFGGCCGTNPEYIRAVKAMLVEAQKNNEFESNRQERQLAICSPINTVVVNQPRIIGERINPTGKKRFKQALVEKDMDYILGQATEQIEAGAEILDVNVGHPEIDEKEMMIKTVKELQSIVSVPLQIDSTKPEVIEAALRVYNGKAIVNSVNGEDKVLDTILPIVKKYGAAVIGLALDENGIPADYKGRVEIAKKILNKALSYGIPKEDVIIDCLVLTVSAEQKAAGETLKALNIVKNELGLRTVLGVSNISFGLPNRELVNKTFLTMALTNGLDLPIMNPNVPSMVWAVRTYKVLADIDKNSMEFISHADEYTEVVGNSKTKEGAVPADNGDANDGKNSKLLKAMEQGLKNEGAELTRAYLENKDAMEIINDMLIPALDVVGDKFEKGKIFLPQLIMAADVAKVCFDEVKNYMSAKGGQSEQKGKIVIATVKGDIHDIGKNIVKVILENYGYNVIDLGRDVDPMKVVEAVKENDVKLVGLSALMTTTLGSMEDTINLLKENNLDCKIMVGGAVLTEDYAMKIGADYYAKDAKRSADIAKEVLG